MKKRRRGGFTLAEVMISTGVMAVAGIGVFQALNSGMILFAKNTAVTVSHQEGRRSVNRLTRDVHSAVSVPQLIDANFQPVENQPVDGTGTPTGTVGVSFQVVAAGPHYVKKDPAVSTMIMIEDFNQAPDPGMRLVCPHFEIESDIIKHQPQQSQANHTNVWMADAAETKIAPKLKTGYYAIAYYTQRVAYVVKNGELQFYRQKFLNGTTTPSWIYDSTVARFITSPTPFTVPLSAAGTPDSRYVGIRLTAADPKASNRNFRSTATLLDTAVPYRSRLTKYQ